MIPAHTGQLAAIQFSPLGNRVATASDKGKKIFTLPFPEDKFEILFLRETEKMWITEIKVKKGSLKCLLFTLPFPVDKLRENEKCEKFSTILKHG